MICADLSGGDPVRRLANGMTGHDVDGPSSRADEPSEPARATRTNLLLSGTIEAGDVKGQVRIRNLSETGALLEGAALPLAGERLTLRRLGLEIGATVIWAANSRCGVRFEGSISVAGWRTGTWIAPIARSDQARVDRIQAAVRAGTLPTGPTEHRPHNDPTETSGYIDGRIARELMRLQRLMNDMADELSDDPAVLARFTVTLQKFDIASQVLGHLAAVLSSSDQAMTIDAIGMDELRVRLGHD